MRASDRFFVPGVYCMLSGRRLPVADLSVGGFFVATEAPPSSQPVIELELELGGRPPFRLLGRVTWINEPAARKAQDLPAGFGIQITRIAFPDKLAIVDMLKRTSFPARPSEGAASSRKPPATR